MANDHDKFTCGCKKCEESYVKYITQQPCVLPTESLTKTISKENIELAVEKALKGRLYIPGFAKINIKRSILKSLKFK